MSPAARCWWPPRGRTWLAGRCPDYRARRRSVSWGSPGEGARRERAPARRLQPRECSLMAPPFGASHLRSEFSLIHLLLIGATTPSPAERVLGARKDVVELADGIAPFLAV